MKCIPQQLVVEYFEGVVTVVKRAAFFFSENCCEGVLQYKSWCKVLSKTPLDLYSNNPPNLFLFLLSSLEEHDLVPSAQFPS